ncbi:hypothetical protein [Clostridium cylindrosporum]|uniref:Uncharacterized protein n=1 Tax=Clostridium cylindrosporum DSM 605 TaxID=1121307 RepID=A0A0J8D9D4_CLOCY|nr:hypothetical protein [Clostridium cylindrosporum]KMT22467.1 hypothetical protein CLCY_10c00120 [Clostridium cylindrosporum DSM 605]
MKKILSTILPSLLIFTFIWIDSMFPESKYILLGIYLLFPIIFIIQGIICSSSIRNMIIGCLLSSMAVIIPTSIWYNMTSMVTPVIIYLSLAIFVFAIKQNKKTNKS